MYVNPQKLHPSVQNAWEPPKLKKFQRNLVGDINDLIFSQHRYTCKQNENVNILVYGLEQTAILRN